MPDTSISHVLWDGASARFLFMIKIYNKTPTVAPPETAVALCARNWQPFDPFNKQYMGGEFQLASSMSALICVARWAKKLFILKTVCKSVAYTVHNLCDNWCYTFNCAIHCGELSLALITFGSIVVLCELQGCKQGCTGFALLKYHSERSVIH